LVKLWNWAANLDACLVKPMSPLYRSSVLREGAIIAKDRECNFIDFKPAAWLNCGKGLFIQSRIT
jgi:hypothetical protein